AVHPAMGTCATTSGRLLSVLWCSCRTFSASHPQSRATAHPPPPPPPPPREAHPPSRARSAAAGTSRTGRFPRLEATFPMIRILRLWVRTPSYARPPEHARPGKTLRAASESRQRGEHGRLAGEALRGEAVDQIARGRFLPRSREAAG